MASYLIPIPSSTSQRFGITLAGNNYFLQIVWRNSPSSLMDNAGWFLDIQDNVGNPIIQGIALVPQDNLLAQDAYLQLGYNLYLQGDGTVSGNPTYSNLGVNFNLYAVF